jgi:glucokinase
MAKEAYWVGFDLGGTKMMAAVFDGDFKEKGRERKKTKAREGVKAGMERIVKTVEEALVNAGIAKEQLGGIGVGCPAPLDLKEGIITNAPNLGWKDAPLKDTLEKAFGCTAIVANDVDAGLFGEYRFGAAKGARCVVGIFPGTGIGGACVYEGKLLVGKNTSCMEIGHLPVVPQGQLCGCGQRGCLETVASRLAIAAAAATAAYRGEAPHLLETAGTDMANIRSSALADAIKAGDSSIEQVVRHAARWLGRGVAVAVNLLAPDMVVIGGGLVEAMPGFYLEEVEDSARSHCMTAYRKTFKIVKAELGDNATATGAAALARESTEKQAKE